MRSETNKYCVGTGKKAVMSDDASVQVTMEWSRGQLFTLLSHPQRTPHLLSLPLVIVIMHAPKRYM
jgi:hypothetical protein